MLTHYKSCKDFPVYNWRKCIEEQDYRFCRIGYEIGNDSEVNDSDREAFQDLSEDIVLHFGIPEKTLELISLKSQLILLHLEFSITGNKVLLNRIRFFESKLQEFNSEDEDQKASIEDEIIAIENWRKFSIETKSISVYKYNKLRDAFTDHCKKMRAQMLKYKEG